jgi:nucleotide-binding universal stress UspA family protein
MNQSSIVVGVKELQPTALRFAAQAAVDRQAHLIVVHSLDVRVAGDFVGMPHDTWHAAGERVLQGARTFVKNLDPSPSADYVLHSWSAYEALREQAANASMVVVGVDGAAWFGPLFAGSVTERLITHSDVPVAVIPELASSDETSGPIIVAIDTRTPAAGPLRYAFTEADRTTHELQVAHAIPEGDLFHGSQSHKIDVSEVLAGWCEEFPDVKVRHRFFFDDPDGGCLRASEEASLLVLGRRKTQIFGHPVLTEIAQRVHCPCVVVPDEWKAH